MKKLLTLSLLITLIGINVWGQSAKTVVKSPTLHAAGNPHLLHVANVTSKAPSTTCDTITNIDGTCDPLIYIYVFDSNNGDDSGYVSGNNFLLQSGVAEEYDFTGVSGLTVTGISFQLGVARFHKTSDKITVTCWAANGPGGSPGTVLFSKPVNINTLGTQNTLNNVNIPTPINNPGKFFVGFTLSYPYKGGQYDSIDAVAAYQTPFAGNGGVACDTANHTAWGQYDFFGTGPQWYNYKSDTLFGVGASLSIYADVCVASGCGPITVNPSSASICNKKSVTLTASGAGVTSFTWAPSTGLNVTTGATVTAKPTTTTTYTVSGNGGACSTTVTVTVKNTPTVTLSKGTCTGHAVLLTANASSGGDPLKYQWKLNNTNITGATKSTYSATVTGSYTCQVTDKTTSCKTTSKALSVTVSCRLEESGAGAFDANAYPNPFTQSITVNISSTSSDVATVELMDFSGRTLRQYNNVDAGSPFVINENLSSGVYFVRITQGESSKMLKIVKN